MRSRRSSGSDRGDVEVYVALKEYVERLDAELNATATRVIETFAPPEAAERRLPTPRTSAWFPTGRGTPRSSSVATRRSRSSTGNLRASRLTILYGSSGVGKTSLLQAGVVHDLHEQVLANLAAGP